MMEKMPERSVFLFSPEVYQYHRVGKHPSRPQRLQRTGELLAAYNAFDENTRRIVAPRLATEDELATFHSREYIRAVRALSDAAFEKRVPEEIEPARFGFEHFESQQVGHTVPICSSAVD